MNNPEPQAGDMDAASAEPSVTGLSGNEPSGAETSSAEIESNPQKVALWIESLMEANGAALVKDKPGSGTYPVVLKRADHGQQVVVDASSVPFITEALQRKEAVRLLGNRGNARIRTAALILSDCSSEAGKVFCTLSYPSSIELEFRRNNFRAPLRKGLDSTVNLALNGEETGFAGKLKDLSMTGARVQFPMRAAEELKSGTVFTITISFPAGQSVKLDATLCHCEVNLQENLFFGGFDFAVPNHSQEKSLWYFVREIEREFARGSTRSRELTPSALFLPPVGESAVPEPVKENPYLTHEARYMAETGDFLAGQILVLRSGNEIDGQLLSRHADRLVRLLMADRDETLFSLCCLKQSPLVNHSLTVATWLTHIAIGIHMPADKIKAIAASALIHDLGKAVNDKELNDSALSLKRSPDSGHVDLLLSRLGKCRWLSPEIVREVAQHINAYLDGSGYPPELAGDKVSQLGRLAAVIDAVDMARRGVPEGASEESPEGQPMRFGDISTLLQGRGGQLDRKWVLYFFKHFGDLPVGAFAETESGRQGWIRRRNLEGNCTVFVPCEGTQRPDLRTTGYGITGKALAALGVIREIAPSALVEPEPAEASGTDAGNMDSADK